MRLRATPSSSQAQAAAKSPAVCPRCHKPLVDFDAPAPAEAGTTCNPINSPTCWNKKSLTPPLAPSLPEARADELMRLRDGLDTIDWLLHTDRQSHPGRIARGERVKRDVIELVRALLTDEWLDSRRIPR